MAGGEKRNKNGKKKRDTESENENETGQTANGEWEVLDILKQRFNKEDGVVEYFVKWKGTDASGRPWSPTWEPLKPTDCPDIQANFRARLENAAQDKLASKRKSKERSVDKPANKRRRVQLSDDDIGEPEPSRCPPMPSNWRKPENYDAPGPSSRKPRKSMDPAPSHSNYSKRLNESEPPKQKSKHKSLEPVPSTSKQSKKFAGPRSSKQSSKASSKSKAQPAATVKEPSKWAKHYIGYDSNEPNPSPHKRSPKKTTPTKKNRSKSKSQSYEPTDVKPPIRSPMRESPQPSSSNWYRRSPEVTNSTFKIRSKAAMDRPAFIAPPFELHDTFHDNDMDSFHPVTADSPLFSNTNPIDDQFFPDLSPSPNEPLVPSNEDRNIPTVCAPSSVLSNVGYELFCAGNSELFFPETAWPTDWDSALPGGAPSDPLPSHGDGQTPHRSKHTLTDTTNRTTPTKSRQSAVKAADLSNENSVDSLHSSGIEIDLTNVVAPSPAPTVPSPGVTLMIDEDADTEETEIEVIFVGRTDRANAQRVIADRRVNRLHVSLPESQSTPVSRPVEDHDGALVMNTADLFEPLPGELTIRNRVVLSADEFMRRRREQQNAENPPESSAQVASTSAAAKTEPSAEEEHNSQSGPLTSAEVYEALGIAMSPQMKQAKQKSPERTKTKSAEENTTEKKIPEAEPQPTEDKATAESAEAPTTSPVDESPGEKTTETIESVSTSITSSPSTHRAPSSALEDGEIRDTGDTRSRNFSGEATMRLINNFLSAAGGAPTGTPASSTAPLPAPLQLAANYFPNGLNSSNPAISTQPTVTTSTPQAPMSSVVQPPPRPYFQIPPLFQQPFVSQVPSAPAAPTAYPFNSTYSPSMAQSVYPVSSYASYGAPAASAQPPPPPRSSIPPLFGTPTQPQAFTSTFAIPLPQAPAPLSSMAQIPLPPAPPLMPTEVAATTTPVTSTSTTQSLSNPFSRKIPISDLSQWKPRPETPPPPPQPARHTSDFVSESLNIVVNPLIQTQKEKTGSEDATPVEENGSPMVPTAAGTYPISSDEEMDPEFAATNRPTTSKAAQRANGKKRSKAAPSTSRSNGYNDEIEEIDRLLERSAAEKIAQLHSERGERPDEEAADRLISPDRRPLPPPNFPQRSNQKLTPTIEMMRHYTAENSLTERILPVDGPFLHCNANCARQLQLADQAQLRRHRKSARVHLPQPPPLRLSRGSESSRSPQQNQQPESAHSSQEADRPPPAADAEAAEPPRPRRSRFDMLYHPSAGPENDSLLLSPFVIIADSTLASAPEPVVAEPAEAVGEAADAPIVADEQMDVEEPAGANVVEEEAVPEDPPSEERHNERPPDDDVIVIEDSPPPAERAESPQYQYHSLEHDYGQENAGPQVNAAQQPNVEQSSPENEDGNPVAGPSRPLGTSVDDEVRYSWTDVRRYCAEAVERFLRASQSGVAAEQLVDLMFGEEQRLRDVHEGRGPYLNPFLRNFTFERFGNVYAIGEQRYVMCYFRDDNKPIPAKWEDAAEAQKEAFIRFISDPEVRKVRRYSRGL